MVSTSACQLAVRSAKTLRSEEHTSELKSPTNLVCRLLLEKKMPDRRGAAQVKFRQQQAHARKFVCQRRVAGRVDAIDLFFNKRGAAAFPLHSPAGGAAI